MSGPSALPPGVTAAVLRVNGEDYPVVFPTYHTLLEVLREKCGLTGTKHGCELGECGACAVRVDGEAVLSCLKLAVEVQGCSVETVEGLQDDNELHPLQRAFADFGAAQCGYCTPGILMVASALLDRNDDPDDAEIFEALSGNLCRCTGYHRIVTAVRWAGAMARGDDWRPPEEDFHGADSLTPYPASRPAALSVGVGESRPGGEVESRPAREGELRLAGVRESRPVGESKLERVSDGG